MLTISRERETVCVWKIIVSEREVIGWLGGWLVNTDYQSSCLSHVARYLDCVMSWQGRCCDYYLRNLPPLSPTDCSPHYWSVLAETTVFFFPSFAFFSSASLSQPEGFHAPCVGYIFFSHSRYSGLVLLAFLFFSIVWFACALLYRFVFIYIFISRTRYFHLCIGCAFTFIFIFIAEFTFVAVVLLSCISSSLYIWRSLFISFLESYRFIQILPRNR